MYSQTFQSPYPLLECARRGVVEEMYTQLEVNVTVVVAVAAIVVAAVVVAPILLAVELNGLQGLLLHGGCTIWHHWHHGRLLLRGGCELDLLGGDGLLHLTHV